MEVQCSAKPGDTVLDLIVGSGPGVAPEVVVYNGADAPDEPFKTEITRFAPFGAGLLGGVTVAGADINGKALADNIIVGSGPGIEAQVKVFSAILPDKTNTAPAPVGLRAPRVATTSTTTGSDLLVSEAGATGPQVSKVRVDTSRPGRDHVVTDAAEHLGRW